MEEKQELIMIVGEEEGEGGQPSSWNCDQTEGPNPEIEHRIDFEISDRVKDWIRSVGKAKEGSTLSSQTPWPTIPKVPHLLRGTKDFNKFFQPRVISIGPYHHGKPHLHPFEKIKPLCAQEFLAPSQRRIEDVYKKIKSNIGALRKCYDRRPTNKYDDETLAWMMLMDGCFILQFILCKGNIEVLREHQLPLVELDLFLLENQLPFGVLQLIFETADIPSMKDNIKKFVFSSITRLPEGTSGSKKELEEPAHLLDLLRSALLGGDKKSRGTPNVKEMQEAYAHGCCKKESSSQVNWQSFRHIRELKAAGIHLQPSGTWFLSDISFESHFFHGYLKLPSLFIDDSTKPTFLNLVAYETCPDAPHDYAVTSFLCFLDGLIDHADDVKELRTKKILYNCLGSDEEVARIFNQIANDLVDSNVYEEVKYSIQKHYDTKVNTWIAQALHDHFSTPWTVMAFIAAVVILLLTGVQTYFAMRGN